jgi:hypothetical protein
MAAVLVTVAASYLLTAGRERGLSLFSQEPIQPTSKLAG